MKLIVAMIRPEALPAVQEALVDTEARLASVGEVSDLRRPEPNVYRGSQYRTSRIRLRLEIMLENDAAVDEVVQTILRAAGAGGGRWSGEDLFVMNVDSYRPALAGSAAGALRG